MMGSSKVIIEKVRKGVILTRAKPVAIKIFFKKEIVAKYAYLRPAVRKSSTDRLGSIGLGVGSDGYELKKREKRYS